MAKVVFGLKFDVLRFVGNTRIERCLCDVVGDTCIRDMCII